MASTEESWKNWLCDLEAEDYSLVDQSDTNVVAGSFPSHHHEIAATPQEENLQRSFSADRYCSYAENSSTMSNSSGDDDNNFERPSKTLKVATSNSANTEYLPQTKESSLSSYVLSFNNVNPAPIMNIDSSLKPKGKVVNHGKSFPSKKEPRRNIQEVKKTGSLARSPHQSQDHIIAERRRREKISQQFIALSALIPGLKKMDKASVLGDAIKHVKQLQEQVKLLEEQTKRKRVESVVYVEKSWLSADEDVSDTSSNSGDGNSYDPSKINRSLPEVEARVSEKNVLIRIHCEKQKGLFMNILKEIENLRLSVINSNILLFGTSIVDITITAEMDDEFSLSVKELAKNLRVGLLQFM
ncbi:transcription factor bHLH18-like [Gastrolobium bilobum]|uniref:transcription factor bHLH18-like n=1 Tax=Gastrolobium bilobum TaxID=150636 RepID=UPI002AB13C1B|nr:transcription factor bHLH18-like [Gastrolobium bilobum]